MINRNVIRPPSSPLSDEQKRRVAELLRKEIGHTIKDPDEVQRRVLEEKRQARLTREAWESLGPQERADFESEHGLTATLRRLAELAKREADEHWTKAEAARQDKELREWMQDTAQSVKYGDNHYKMLFALAEEGKQRAQDRQRAREQRDLQAEAFDDETHRIWAGLDDTEREIFTRLMDERPSQLELIQQFKAERRNPIKDINDPQQLYRMAMEKPKPEQWVEPLSNIENIDDPSMLYRMADKQMRKRTAAISGNGQSNAREQ